MPNSTKFICSTLLVLLFCTQTTLSLFWDFAVTTKSKILFFDKHWQPVTQAAHQFDQISAIAYDEAEELIFFTDQKHNNGSIFSLKIPSVQDDPHVIDKLIQRTQNETIRGIAYDPVLRKLYWTDRHNKKIYHTSIEKALTDSLPEVLIDFADENALPDGIAIDICRRKLYWTNANFNNATVECSDLDGQNRQVIVHTDLFLPHGIVVDQLSDRIYWVDDQQGIHFSIESANLDGSDRQMIVKGMNIEPMHLAVTEKAIFWTDMNNNAVWSHAKTIRTNLKSEEDTFEEVSPEDETGPHKVLSFHDYPYGIIARSRFLTNLQNDIHCAATVKNLKIHLLTPKPTNDPLNEQLAKYRREYCLNGGEFSEHSNVCICKIGYDGTKCETSLCHNYCIRGTCTMGSTGYPECTCQKEFHGRRCQTHKCSGYCLNDGVCKLETNGEPTCECKGNFGGHRCENNSTEICSLFCRILKLDPEADVPFGCHDICEDLIVTTDNGVDTYALPKYEHLEVCRNVGPWNGTVLVVMISGVVICLTLVLLIVHALRRLYKPARPRVKKTFRYIQKARNSRNSPDTPLTNRPISTEQCEITIENCCNMNICETPCFDPKLVTQTLSSCDSNVKEDKKILINNMEDELY